MNPKKYYLVLNKDNLRRFGAFVRSPTGKEEAEKYAKSLEKKHKCEFIIK